MTSLRVVTLCVLCAILSSVTTTWAVVTYVYVGDRAIVGRDVDLGVGAQLQVNGRESGISQYSSSTDPHAESYLMHVFQFPGSGNVYKASSISTTVANTDVNFGNFLLRFNAAYLFQGQQYDDVFMIGCGNSGVSFFSPTPFGDGCPGYRVLSVNGQVVINGVNVLQELASLRALMESRR